MNINPHLRKLILAALSLPLIACMAVSGLIATATPSPIPLTSTATTKPTRTPKPTATITSTPFYKVEPARAPVSVAAGGFKFVPVKGYDVEESNGGAFLQSDDEMVIILLEAYAPSSGISLKRLMGFVLNNLEQRYKSFSATDPITTEVGDVKNISIDFTGEEDHDPIAGRVTIYEPLNGKLVYLTVLAKDDQRWEREGQKAYEQVAGSLSFLPIEPWQACPIHTNPGYGTSADYPIRIGGGLAQGAPRTRDYLDALLGPRGELVEYFHSGNAEANGKTLDEYTIIYESTFRKLYFDIYEYDSLRAPLGMQCSARLPAAVR